MRHGWHWSFGWLRRPEMDMPGMYAYEAPDGDICYSDRPEHARDVYLEESAEGFINLAKFPARAICKNRKWTIVK
jgi:hypothetical protein